MLEFAFRPELAAGNPIYRQLADYLQGLIDAGRVVPGERFPATRELCDQLGLGRNTVARAYRLLVDAGVLRKITRLRQQLVSIREPRVAMEMLLKRLELTADNAELLAAMPD